MLTVQTKISKVPHKDYDSWHFHTCISFYSLATISEGKSVPTKTSKNDTYTTWSIHNLNLVLFEFFWIPQDTLCFLSFILWPMRFLIPWEIFDSWEKVKLLYNIIISKQYISLTNAMYSLNDFSGQKAKQIFQSNLKEKEGNLFSLYEMPFLSSRIWPDRWEGLSHKESDSITWLH